MAKVKVWDRDYQPRYHDEVEVVSVDDVGNLWLTSDGDDGFVAVYHKHNWLSAVHFEESNNASSP